MTKLTTLGEITKHEDRIFQLLFKIKHTTSKAKLHHLAQELADLTKQYVPKFEMEEQDEN
ncbi:MAG TPA: hypothetical protein DCW74_05705 [Alteromonas australica]|uniref:Uncharacterized protein n=1 Tax=Alteromonas australica TaxID=589873 RepID=A0A350P1Q0_9ALTE|nr:hypothetical protein [Alteromonas australica]|tara:strand:- start:88 stop:267 length:180 start_codon:yes stop_codon:yes gene_type:complete